MTAKPLFDITAGAGISRPPSSGELVVDRSFRMLTQLSAAAIVAWVQDTLGAEAVDRHEASLAQAVDARLNPPVVPRPLPWSAA